MSEVPLYQGNPLPLFVALSRLSPVAREGEKERKREREREKQKERERERKR